MSVLFMVACGLICLETRTYKLCAPHMRHCFCPSSLIIFYICSCITISPYDELPESEDSLLEEIANGGPALSKKHKNKKHIDRDYACSVE